MLFLFVLFVFFTLTCVSIGSSSSPSKEVTGLFGELIGCEMTANTLVEPPDGKKWLCGLEEKEPLFVRECYGWFYEEAKRKMNEGVIPRCPGLIYTGNPGIGKSSWLNYALVRFLKDGYAVVLERAKANDYFVFRDGKCIHRRKPVDIFVLEELPKEKAVYLFDPDEKALEPLLSSVFTIVATSPQEKHYKALKKRDAPRRYMPCWSLDELTLASKVDPAEVKDRWLQWGGIPRFVNSNNQDGLKSDLKKAIMGMNLSLFLKYLRTPEITEEDQKTISHMVVQYRIVENNNDYSACELDFASEQIGEQVIMAKGEQDWKGLISHYELMRRQEWQGVYLGHLWEHLCHKIVPLGSKGGFTLEPLSESKKKNVKILKEGVKMEQGGATDMQRVVDAGNYFQPSAPNFPVIDAAVKEGNVIYGFQMTVASSHPPKAHEAADLLQLFPKLQLVWVVDGAKKDHIKTKQGFEKSKDPRKKVDEKTFNELENVPQWLLKLQFPKENPFKCV